MVETHYLEVTLNGFLLISPEVHLQTLPFLIKSGSRGENLHSIGIF